MVAGQVERWQRFRFRGRLRRLCLRLLRPRLIAERVGQLDALAENFMRIHRLILAQNVPALAHKTRAVGDEAVAAAARARVDGAGDREHVASLLERRIGGDERARTLERRFDHHGRKTQAADDAVADGKMPALRRRSRRVFGKEDAG